MVHLKLIREYYGKAYELPSDCILGYAPLDDATWQIPYSLLYQTELCSAHIHDRFVVTYQRKTKGRDKKKTSRKTQKTTRPTQAPNRDMQHPSTLRTLVFKPEILESADKEKAKTVTDVEAKTVMDVNRVVVADQSLRKPQQSGDAFGSSNSRSKTTTGKTDTNTIVLDDDYILLPTNWPIVDADTTSESSESQFSETVETPCLVDDDDDDDDDDDIGDDDEPYDSVGVIVDLSDASSHTDGTNNNSSDDEEESISIIRPASSVSVPKISIIMTTYNCIKYIEHAIRSLQSQTMTNWELVVVDDRSTDGTDTILREIAEEDDRIVYLHNRHNVGCYASKNTALSYVRGDWLTFHDADDHSMSERLEKQLRFCTTGSATIEYDPTNVRPYDACYVRSLSRQSKTWSWVPITLFIQTSLFKERLGAFDTVRFGADSEMFSRLQCLSLRVGLLQDYLYACPDRWIELSSRTTSLTGNTKNDPIREIYKAAFDRAHYHYIHDKQYARLHADKLHYPFPPLYDQDTSTRTIPFPLIGLDAQHESRLFPKRQHILENLALNNEAE